MKWGVRRYENEDGTLTALGKKHYAVGQADGKSNHRLNLEEKYRKKGYSEQQAAIAAERRVRTEKILAVAAGTTLAAAGVYIAQNQYNKRVDKILSADTTLKRITKSKDGTLHDAFYAANKKGDAKKYVGLFGMEQIARGNRDIFQATIKPKRDLKIASDKNAEKIFQSLRTDPRFKAESQGIIDHYGKVGGRKISDYAAFNCGLVNYNHPSVKKFYAEMQKHGYDGIRDFNDMKYSKYGAKNPLIIFGKDAAKTVSAQKLGREAIEKQYVRENAKKGVKHLTKMSLPMVGLAGTTIAVSKSQENDVVYEYRSQHPNSKLSRQEILERHYSTANS